MVSTSSPTTRSDLAVRNGGGQSAALALRGGQTMWDDRQRAALVAMGVSDKATNAELAVFLHQCQRTGLDPFSRQIYLIHRAANENGKWVNKPTTQTGIDGYRIIRDRIARRDGLRVEYEPAIWWDIDGGRHEAWLWDEPPAACTVAILVDGRRFSSTLRFAEYCQRKKDGELNSMWRTKPAHMIEKCAEADALRRVFPNDLAGVTLEDAAPLGDPDAPAAASARPSAQQIRQQRQPVTAEVVTPDPPPAPAGPAPAHPGAGGDDLPPLPGEDQEEAPGSAGEEPPGETGHDAPGTVTDAQLRAVWTVLSTVFHFDKDDRDSARGVCAHIAGRELASSKDLSRNEAKSVLDTLGHWQHQAEKAGEDARAWLITVMAGEEADDE